MEATSATPTRSRRVLHSREKELIYHVHQYFKEEKACGGFIIPPSRANARTAKATNVCEKTDEKICSKRGRTSPERGVFLSPKKRRASATVTSLDDFDKCIVRRTALSFYERQEVPTLKKIQEELKENISFRSSIASLHKILKEIGFTYAKVDGRKFLMERSDVAAARTTFLRDIKKVKQASQNIVYLDETWVNQNYTVAKCWVDTTSPTATGIRQPTGKGSRLIILHAGTKNGFVENAKLLFKSKMAEITTIK